ncbi:MAG: sterol desaturase family protein [Chitinophagaceae bacterium]
MKFRHYFLYAEKFGSRYFLVAGIAFSVFYLLFKRTKRFKKIQSRFPRLKDYTRDIAYAIITIFIFALVFLVIFDSPVIMRHTWFYRQISEHSWFYFFLAFPLLFVLHDTYFYRTHRSMHHKKLFRLFHHVYHHSTNPSPWSAYAFHPLEALVEAGIFVLFLFVMSIHPLHIFMFFFLMTVNNAYGHLGFERYPRGFKKSSIGKWINTSINHNLHHPFFKGNYGLYFTCWDRLKGTLRPDYDMHFEEVTAKNNNK